MLCRQLENHPVTSMLCHGREKWLDVPDVVDDVMCGRDITNRCLGRDVGPVPKDGGDGNGKSFAIVAVHSEHRLLVIDPDRRAKVTRYRKCRDASATADVKDAGVTAQCLASSFVRR